MGADIRDQPPTAARYPGATGRSGAMILIGLVIVIAVLMMVVVPRIWRKL